MKAKSPRPLVASLLIAATAASSAAPIDCPVTTHLTVSGSDHIAAVPCRNTGTLLVVGGGTLTHHAGGVLKNENIVEVRSSGTFDNAGTVDTSWTVLNAGWLNNAAGARLDITATADGAGSLENRIGGTLANRGAIENRGGEVLNTGRLDNHALAMIVNRAAWFNGWYHDLPGQSALLANAGSFSNSAGASFANSATVTSSGQIVNEGAMLNRSTGVMRLSGSLSGSGSLDNQGRLELLPGSQVSLGSSANLSGGVLDGGTWRVNDGATLAVGSGPIHTLGSGIDLALTGAGASFVQLAALEANHGTLTVAERSITLGAPFTNRGSLTAAEGGHVTIHGSTQLAGGTLGGGLWRVAAGGGSASLVIDSGPIHTLAAGTTVILHGAEARFDQLALARNDGRLEVDHRFESARALVNTGVIDLSGPLVNRSSLTNEGSGRLFVAGGDNLAGASLTVSAGHLATAGLLRNAGAIEVAGEGHWTVGGTLHNAAGGAVRTSPVLFDVSRPAARFVQGSVIDNAGLVDLRGPLQMEGLTIYNRAGGTLVMQDAAFLPTDHVSPVFRIENEGHFRSHILFNMPAAVINRAGGLMENTNDFRLTTLDNQGSLVNRGRITVQHDLINHAAGRVVNHGRFELSRFVNAGSFSGTGTLDAAGGGEVGASGIVAPGHSIGTLHVNTGERGDITFDGTLEIEIDGAEHDVLSIGGWGLLRFGDEAALRFHLLGVPVLDRDMGFLLAERLEGFDADVRLLVDGLASHIGWRVFERDKDLFIRFFDNGGGGTLPSPGTLLLVAPGLAFLVRRAARRLCCTA